MRIEKLTFAVHQLATNDFIAEFLQIDINNIRLISEKELLMLLKTRIKKLNNQELSELEKIYSL